MKCVSWASVVVLATVVLSCGGTEGTSEASRAETGAATANGPPEAAAVAAIEPSAVSAPIEVPVPLALAAPAAEARDATVPPGTFPTVEALCAAQKVMIVPQLRQAEAWLREREMATPLSPSCERAPAVLAQMHVSLHAPFHELAAIRIETGTATEVRLVVRTDEGWRAAPRALMVDVHDDPGCPSILRDGPVREVRVESAAGVPALVVIDEASRGAGEEVAADDSVVYWSLELRRATACRLEARDFELARMTCDEPVVIRALRTPGQGDADRRAQVRFTTDYRLDTSGRIVATEAYDDAKTWE